MSFDEFFAILDADREALLYCQDDGLSVQQTLYACSPHYVIEGLKPRRHRLSTASRLRKAGLGGFEIEGVSLKRRTVPWWASREAGAMDAGGIAADAASLPVRLIS